MVIDGISIKEAETISVLGFDFNCCLTWAAMVDTMVLHCRQCLGCLCRILDYLHSNTLQLAYRAFIKPIMEYGNVAIMGASATQLSRLSTVQNAATTLCHTSFSVVIMLPLFDCC